ncbi:MAG: carboxypeptidase-like regulatory domain-containing protein [Bacteroidetes bacterium]|nr:carboxypeptidase-like regulatory domain-containing protein [Bacteroidota bacterium]
MKIIHVLLLLISIQTWGQNNKIKGVIKDSETLQPIPYVSVYSENELKNNFTGSISNENGEFTLTISNKSKIIFSDINYETFSTLKCGYLNFPVMQALRNPFRILFRLPKVLVG